MIKDFYERVRVSRSNVQRPGMNWILALTMCGLDSDDAVALAEVLEEENCDDDATITELYLDNNAIADEGVQAIANVLSKTQLTRIGFERNQISSVGCQALAEALIADNLPNLGNSFLGGKHYWG